MKKHSRFQIARKILIFWCLFIGIGALFGGVCMLLRPDGSLMGMQSLLPYFQVLPLAPLLFQNYIFPGIALLCVNCIPNLLAAGLLLRRRRGGVVLGGCLGITLILWICIQFVIFPLNFMDVTYFLFGLAQVVTGYVAYVFDTQERFCVCESDFANIGSDPTRLVVYFSRLGYTKKLALEQAQRTGAQVYEIRATERTSGTPGFWWCGRYGMHAWPMPIEPIGVDLRQYDRVTICTPVWVFSLAGPVRSFCKEARGQIKSADYIITHHMRAKFSSVAAEMDRLLDLTATDAVSVACPLGRQTAPVSLRRDVMPLK